MNLQNPATSRPHKPVLLIGMGGTGKQVLLNLRRMFFDHYGTPTLPHIGQIWIDTDTRNVTLDGHDLDFLLKEVDFNATETVNTELRQSDLRNYYSHKSDYPHIFNWFDTSLERHGEIQHGAGQIRCFGRLAFFHHYKEIIDRVRDKYAEIRDAGRQAKLLSDYGIRLDASQVDTWLIFSVAGGTGSGMFLDMAFALKDLEPNVSLRGIILLPSVFNSDYQERIFGNSYAALMELEHYNLARGNQEQLHRFPVAWTRQQFNSGATLRGPVFHTAYLIGNKPRGRGGSLAVSQKNAICEMLAETLFIEYGATLEALSSDWRSKRSNFADSLQTTVSYEYSGQGNREPFTEEFSCGYSSLGLSKLHVPVQRIAMVVRHRLGIELVQSWLRQDELPNSLDAVIDRTYLPRLNLAERGSKGGFVRELSGVSASQSLLQMLRQAIAPARLEFRRSASQPNVGEKLQAWLKDGLLIQQLDSQHPDKSRWGALSRQLHLQYTDALIAKASAELDAIVADILATPRQRFTFARATLRRITAILEEQRREFERKVEQHRKSANNSANTLSDRLNWLNDCKGRFTRTTIVDVAVDLAEEQATFELKAQTAQAAAKVCARLSEIIGSGTVKRDHEGREVVVESGLLKQLSDLEHALNDELLEALQSRLRGLEQDRPSPIYQDLYDSQDFSDFYIMPDGRTIDDSLLIELDHRYFEEAAAGRPRSLWQLREALQAEGSRRLTSHLLAFVSQATRHLDARTVDVIERLTLRLRPETPQYDAAVQRLLDFGQPWLDRVSHHVEMDQLMRNSKEEITVAVSGQSQPSAAKTFRETLSKQWPTPLSFVDSTRDRVYVTSEMAAVPLMAIPDLDRYRNMGYFGQLQDGRSLHTDVNFEKFQDLLIKERHEVEAYLRALEILGTAILCGVVRGSYRAGTDDRRGIVEFSFEDKKNWTANIRPLGVFSLAVRRLSAPDAESLRDNIRRTTMRRIDHFSDEQLAQWIYLLHHQAQHNPVGHSALAAVLIGLAKDEENRNPGLDRLLRQMAPSLDQWSAEVPPGSGFRTMLLDQEVPA